MWLPTTLQLLLAPREAIGNKHGQSSQVSSFHLHKHLYARVGLSMSLNHFHSEHNFAADLPPTQDIASVWFMPKQAIQHLCFVIKYQVPATLSCRCQIGSCLSTTSIHREAQPGAGTAWEGSS